MLQEKNRLVPFLREVRVMSRDRLFIDVYDGDMLCTK